MTDETVRSRPLFDTEGSTLLRHRFLLLAAEGPGRWTVSGPRVAIGTAPGNDVQLDDPTVSRHHCEIVARGDHYVVRDLDSTNGTFISGVRITEAYLQPGMRLTIGDQVVEFEPDARLTRVAPSERHRFGELVGRSLAMRSAFSLLEEIAPTKLTLLLSGETGTGKELAARAVHEASDRSPFVVVDCAALHGNLIESELFGHERGAFTGADRRRAGAFETAHGGTLFLDEVGELPLELQPKLLRALERREFSRLGSNTVIDVDVRVIAATHRDLQAMVEEGTFREDLYYRLAEITIDLPPLRERLEDIRIITRAVLEREGGSVQEVDPAVWTLLEGRAYRGNVRELRNLVRRAAALARGASVLQSAAVTRAMALDRPVETGGEDVLHVDLPLKQARKLWVDEHTERYLLRLLERYDNDVDAVAERADVHRKSVQRLLRELGHPTRASDAAD